MFSHINFWVVTGYAFSVSGFVMAAILFSNMRSSPTNPGTTVAWLLGMIFLPVVTVPLYLVIGGARLRKTKKRKARLTFNAQLTVPNPPDNAGTMDALFALKDAPPATGGNHVETLFDGVQVYERLMALIDGATESISFTTFILSKDDVAKAFVDALARRAKEGIKVKLLVDALGSFWSKGSFLDPLREAGGEVADFMPILPTRRKAAANFRMHRKMYIFDEKEAIIGGKNISREYMGPTPEASRWVDSSLYLRGPAMCNLVEIFAQDWAFATGASQKDVARCADMTKYQPQGDVSVQTVASGPDADNEPFYDVMLTALLNCKQRVWVVTPYFVPDETILKMLCILAKLGRDVRLVVPKSSDAKLPDLARRYPMRELFRAGGKIFLYTPTVLHAKLLLIDDDLVTIGSPNMDMRSFYLNFELALFIYEPNVVNDVEKFVEGLMPDSFPYTRYHGRVRGIITEAMENFARILSPLI
ncbi:cardiolipin synthase [soil metagenome]